ncbi:MAG: hypothetical protein KKE73_08605 [Proteobacteria bacterium]|nr:hypothetical protein [Pseudomonadota bacterium]
MDATCTEELTLFLESWSKDPNRTKRCFLRFMEHLEGLSDVNLTFIARPGITYSLRASHANQQKRSLFAMVDIIDDDPADRWLSVCFYNELVDDPDQRGDEVPEGLLGEDAKCFDLYEFDDEFYQYIENRLTNACRSASKEC